MSICNKTYYTRNFDPIIKKISTYLIGIIQNLMKYVKKKKTVEQ